MSQATTSSCAPPTPPEHRCGGCGVAITDRLYRVQGRQILPDGRIKLGPGFDDYCAACYGLLPTIQELIHARPQ